MREDLGGSMYGSLRPTSYRPSRDRKIPLQIYYEIAGSWEFADQVLQHTGHGITRNCTALRALCAVLLENDAYVVSAHLHQPTFEGVGTDDKRSRSQDALRIRDNRRDREARTCRRSV
jgi:hypothetical protein